MPVFNKKYFTVFLKVSTDLQYSYLWVDKNPYTSGENTGYNFYRVTNGRSNINGFLNRTTNVCLSPTLPSAPISEKLLENIKLLEEDIL